MHDHERVSACTKAVSSVSGPSEVLTEMVTILETECLETILESEWAQGARLCS